jgi:hypothetical protein
MNRFWIVVLGVLLLPCWVFARRANPRVSSAPSLQYYILDSDDNDPGKPTYRFLDTTFGSWVRVTGFTNTDTGYAHLTPSQTMQFTQYGKQIVLPPRYIHTNGFVSYDSVPSFTPDSAAHFASLVPNTLLPANSIAGAYPLWCDLELRTSGDSSKIYYRVTTDTCYVSFYNMFLRGANGRARATFQIVYIRPDSSVTFMYRSFDGGVDGESAAAMFQRLATVGVQDSANTYASVYLDRGVYYARSLSSSAYEQPLHNGLAVLFLRAPANIVRMNSINTPSSDHFEFSASSFSPKVTFENLGSTSRTIYISNTITNVTTGSVIYSRLDSAFVASGSFTFTAPIVQSVPCGEYRLVSTVSVANNGDGWTYDNTLVRNFSSFSQIAFPLLEDFHTLDRCSYNVYGATFVPNALDAMRDAVAPPNTGAVLLDRVPATGDYTILGGDTLATAPIDLSARTNPYLIFSYQRGLISDSIQAGIRNRTLTGPEVKFTSDGTITSGDSLLIEAIPSSASGFNPAASSWQVIGKIYGGIDLAPQKMRISIPSAYAHNHSRFRFRLAATNDGAKIGMPFDDNDNFVIDAIQIVAPFIGNHNETDLEVTGVDLGAGNFNRIPRDAHSLFPKVKIASNGLQANQAVYQIRLIIKDQLNREVYHRLQSLPSPAAHSDVSLTMPEWIIEGSQGGIFTCRTTVEQTFSDYYRANDTSIFYRPLGIGDSYGYDDGSPDTVGTMTAAENDWFYYTFTPIKTDSLRAFDFYHLTANGTTIWSITFRNLSGAVIYSRAFNYDVLDRGFQRAQLQRPVLLSKDSVYVIQCDMTTGFALGGDASRSLVIPVSSVGSSTKYIALNDSLLKQFASASGQKYYTADSNAFNSAAGGPILPMMRLVFRGSSTFLPVELIRLSALRLNDGSVKLAFTTAKEENVSHFTLERNTLNGYSEVSTLSPHNSFKETYYSFIDELAPKERISYRLVESDLDGSEKVIGTCEAEAITSVSPLISFSPNPVSDILHISSAEPIEKLAFYDAAGRSLRSEEGLYLLSFDMDLRGIPSGVYVVESVSGGVTSRTKIVVAR